MTTKTLSNLINAIGVVAHNLNYVTTNRFYVEIDSTIVACFTECSGLGANVDKEVHLEGGVNDQQRIFLGHITFDDVTLKRGVTNDMYFGEWLSRLSGPEPVMRHNVNILVFTQEGEIMKSWTLIGAIPVGWKAPALQADGNGVAIEELTLAYEGLNVGNEAGGGILTKRDKQGFFTSLL